MDDPAFGRVPRALRGLDDAGVPWGTSKENRPKGNEGMRLKANDGEQFGFKMETEAAVRSLPQAY